MVILPEKDKKNTAKQTFNVEKFLKVLKNRGFTHALFIDAMQITDSKFYRWLKRKSEPSLAEYFYMVEILKLKYYHSLINMDLIRDEFASKLARHFSPNLPSTLQAVPEISTIKRILDNVKSVSFPHAKRVSELFSVFPQVSGVAFSNLVVSDPTMTEKNDDGYHCTFECHIDRLYMHDLSKLYPGRFSPPLPILDQYLIRNTERKDPYGKDIWEFVESGETYPWCWWDICGGVYILNQELAAGNPSVVRWHTNLAVDDADGWRRQYYNLDDDDEVSGMAVGSGLSLEKLESMSLDDLMGDGTDDDGDFPDEDDDEDIGLDIDPAEERKF